LKAKTIYFSRNATGIGKRLTSGFCAFLKKFWCFLVCAKKQMPSISCRKSRMKFTLRLSENALLAHYNHHNHAYFHEKQRSKGPITLLANQRRWTRGKQKILGFFGYQKRIAKACELRGCNSWLNNITKLRINLKDIKLVVFSHAVVAWAEGRNRLPNIPTVKFRWSFKETRNGVAEFDQVCHELQLGKDFNFTKRFC